MDIQELERFRLQIQQFVRTFGLLEQTVTPCGFPLSVSQVYALQELEKQTLSISELAQRLQLERSSVSRLVDLLVKNEFVTRNANMNNRREMHITLTDKGLRTIHKVRDQSLQFYLSVLQDLPAQEIEIILTGVEKLTSAIKRHKEVMTHD